MTVRREKFITREMVRANSNVLFVFGDNMARRGMGGQAAEMRGEPNAIGIPTKHFPSMAPAAMFRDRDWEEVIPAISAEIFKLRDHLLNGGDIALPEDGIGTGLARLEQNAPKIFAYIQGSLKELEDLQ